jgi:hypothetical protein
MEASGWVDLTHVRAVVKAGDVEVALAGTDDSHLKRARYSLIAGPAEPAAAVRIGVTHSPEPALLRSFARDGYELVLARTYARRAGPWFPFGPADRH